MNFATFGGAPVVQVHVSSRCNLRCVHCYSSSGPEGSSELALVDLLRFLEFCRGEGYEALSLSGGEPLLYRELPMLLESAKEMGYCTSLVTNGTIKCPTVIKGLVNRIAISLDGNPARHNHIRGSKFAFQRLIENLDSMRESGATLALIHALTTESIADLPWLVSFAVEQHIPILQVHPLEAEGRAGESLSASVPNNVALARACLLLILLQSQASQSLRIVSDILSRCTIEGAYAKSRLDKEQHCERMADIANPLVVLQSGEILPFSFGVSSHLGMGNVRDFRSRCRQGQSFHQKLLVLKEFLLQSAEMFCASGDSFVNWFGHLKGNSLKLLNNSN